MDAETGAKFPKRGALVYKKFIFILAEIHFLLCYNLRMGKKRVPTDSRDVSTLAPFDAGTP